MHTKRTFLRRSARLLLWLGPIVLVLGGLQITLLACPQLLLSQCVQVGSVSLHHDGLAEDEARNLATEIDRRLQGSRFHDATRSDPVFVFRNRDTYELYLKLTFMRIVPQGFNLSIFGNSYVCEPIVTGLGNATGGQPRFSIWDGDLAHIAAHEVGHQYIVDRIGRGVWKSLPEWKQEGLPEYVANIGDIRADRSQSLLNRINVLRTDSLWPATPPGHRHGWDREHYEAGLLVEFLFEVHGYSLEQVISDNVTRADAYSNMMKWAAAQTKSTS